MKDKIITDKELDEFKNKKIVKFKRKHVITMSGKQLNNKIITPRKVLLSPWLKENQIVMIFAEAGVGKTFFALNCAHALVSGKDFLKFQAHGQQNVLYVDSEMDEEELRDRWIAIAKGEEYENMHFYTPSMFDDFTLPDITTKDGQMFYEEAIEKNKINVVFFDSLGFLTDLNENDSRAWNFALKWMIKMKNMGISVGLIHHTNKGNKEYRGSTKLGAITDNIIFLEKREEILELNGQEIGAKFKVIYKKTRGFYGNDKESFDAWLDGKGIWNIGDAIIADRDKLFSYYKMGMPIKDICLEIKMALSTAYRLIDDAKAVGILPKRLHGNRKK